MLEVKGQGVLEVKSFFSNDVCCLEKEGRVDEVEKDDLGSPHPLCTILQNMNLPSN